MVTNCDKKSQFSGLAFPALNRHGGATHRHEEVAIEEGLAAVGVWMAVNRSIHADSITRTCFYTQAAHDAAKLVDHENPRIFLDVRVVVLSSFDMNAVGWANG